MSVIGTKRLFSDVPSDFRCWTESRRSSLSVRLSTGNIQELVREGEANNAGRELVRFAKLMTPGRSLWYGTLAMDRLIFDELQKMLDPNAGEAFKRVEDRMRRETGQRFFSRPGKGLPPQRAPDLGAAFGN